MNSEEMIDIMESVLNELGLEFDRIVPHTLVGLLTINFVGRFKAEVYAAVDSGIGIEFFGVKPYFDEMEKKIEEASLNVDAMQGEDRWMRFVLVEDNHPERVEHILAAVAVIQVDEQGRVTQEMCKTKMKRFIEIIENYWPIR